MARDFSRFEMGIDRMAQQHPDMPRDTVMLIRVAYRTVLSLDARLEAHFERHGLNQSAWLALMMIYASPEQRVMPSELSDFLTQSRTHMTRVADDLLGKGLIHRHPSEDDRRRIDLTLTPAGVRLIDKLLPLTWAEYESALGDLTPADRKKTTALLRRWLDHLEAEPAEAAPAAPASRKARAS